MPKKKAKMPNDKDLLAKQVVWCIDVRVLITVVVLALYFVFGLKVIPIHLKHLGLAMLALLGLTVVEYLLARFSPLRLSLLYAHFVIDLCAVSYVMHLLSPRDRIYYLPLYVLVTLLGTLVVSVRFGYVLAGLSSVSLSLVYALLGLTKASAAPCPYGEPINLLVINSSFFFLVVALVQAALAIREKSR